MDLGKGHTFTLQASAQVIPVQTVSQALINPCWALLQLCPLQSSNGPLITLYDLICESSSSLLGCVLASFFGFKSHFFFLFHDFVCLKMQTS